MEMRAGAEANLLDFDHEIGLIFAHTSRFHVWVASASAASLRQKILENEPIAFTTPMPVALLDGVLRVKVNGRTYKRQASGSNPQIVAVRQFQFEDALRWPLVEAHAYTNHLDIPLIVRDALYYDGTGSATDPSYTTIANPSSWSTGTAGKHIATLFGGQPIRVGCCFEVKLMKQGDTLVGIGTQPNPAPEVAHFYSEATGSHYAGIVCWNGEFSQRGVEQYDSTQQGRIENGCSIRVSTKVAENDADCFDTTWSRWDDLLQWTDFACARFNLCDGPYFPLVTISGGGNLRISEARKFAGNADFVCFNATRGGCERE